MEKKTTPDDTNPKHKIFVYGTLKRGFYNHREYLDSTDSSFLGVAYTSNDYTLYINALPFLVEEASDAPVEGELYEVDNDTLKRIDELEGHPYAYKRQRIRVKDSDGNEVLCYAYLYPNIFKYKRGVIKEYKYD